MRTPRRLSIESLEHRKLMAVDVAGGAASAAEEINQSLLDDIQSARPVDIPIIWLNHDSGCVEINGSDTMDLVTIEETTLISSQLSLGSIQSPGVVPGIRVTHENVITGDETIKKYALSDVEKICFEGGAHNDIFQNLTSIPSDAKGGEGDDQLYGGSGDDVLRGGDGSDTIEGGAGNDEIYGGRNEDEPDILRGNGGRDIIHGGEGDDVIEGGIGHDELYGGEGSDTIDGGDGNDSLYGDPDDSQDGGQDELTGGDGDDTLSGGPKDDILKGNAGDDDMWGDDGADHILGGTGDDEAWGGQGADVLEGGEDDDELHGQDGPDRVYGGGGIDELFGGGGDDGLWGGGREDTVTGGNGNDRFLMHEVKDANDLITDESDADVQIHFENGERTKHDGVWYGSETWLYDEILEVDEALAVMVRRTHNNALMQTASGKDLTFIRVGAPEEPATNVAWSKDGSGKITISDLAFDAYNSAGEEAKDAEDDSVHHTVYHEVAHNWEDENDNWGDFKDISGWRNGVTTGFQWVSDPTMEGFVSDYAATSAKEDFAETMAAYFLFDTGESLAGARVSSLSQLPEKEAFMEDFFDSLM